MRPDESPQIPALARTGERLTTDSVGPNVPEHLHRYALACGLADDRHVVDVASGEGYGSMLLASRAAGVVGVDVDATAVAHATAKYVRDNLRFVRAAATALPLADASVDLAVSFETIEHLQDHDAMLAEIRRVMRPDGVLVMSSPDRRFYSEATGHVNPFHVRELDAAEFIALVRRFFRHVTPLFQRVVHGSLIVPGEPVGGFAEYRGGFSGFDAAAGLREAMYVIVIASDQPLPPCHATLWSTTGHLDPPPRRRGGLARLFGHHE